MLLLMLYTISICGLGLYTAHMLWLMMLSQQTSQPVKPLQSVNDHALPTVTVQLPIYNERTVVERLIDSICALDYPSELLQIQVLDDSTDATTLLIERRVCYWQQQGIQIVNIRRPTRTGYKAGALAHGLSSATGEFIAIFDADFVPQPQWLRHTIAYFCQAKSEQLGLVQTRWGHLNATYSALTTAQRLILDGFAIEQSTRAGQNLLPIFHGTAGLWRRSCIDAAGGWSGQTLAEDADLSYRAHLAGWHIRYDDKVLISAEVPTQMLAWKQQQYRWAKGNMQAARLLLPKLLRSSLAWRQKIDAFFYLTANLMQFFLLFMLVSRTLLLFWPNELVLYLDLFMTVLLAGFIIPRLIDWMRSQQPFPADLGLQTGVAFNNSVALLDGLLDLTRGEFRRTPKQGQVETRQNVSYLLAFDWTTFGELLFAAVALAGCMLAMQQRQWFSLPFLMFVTLGFSWVGGASMWEAMEQSVRRPTFIGEREPSE